MNRTRYFQFSAAFLRLPRPCRSFRGTLTGRHLAGQFCIGKTFPYYLRYCQGEAIRVGERIVFCRTVIVAEDLLSNVAVEVKGLNSIVCALQSRFKRDQKFFMPWVWTSPLTYSST